MGSHSLLQGLFLTQGRNLGLLHCRQILYHLSHKGSPVLSCVNAIILICYFTAKTLKLPERSLYCPCRKQVVCESKRHPEPSNHFKQPGGVPGKIWVGLAQVCICVYVNVCVLASWGPICAELNRERLLPGWVQTKFPKHWSEQPSKATHLPTGQGWGLRECGPSCQICILGSPKPSLAPPGQCEPQPWTTCVYSKHSVY